MGVLTMGRQVYTLTQQQLKVVDQALLNKETAIKGPAGSGKTLVAISIANRLAEEDELALPLEGERLPIVLTTFTNALVNHIRQDYYLDDIKVMTVHRVLSDFIRKNGGKVKFASRKLRAFLESHLDTKRYSVRFMEAEFAFIYGNGLKKRTDYLQAVRIGRGRGNLDREYVFDLFEQYQALLAKNNEYDFSDIGNLVLEFIAENDTSPTVKHLILDEVQDMPKTWIRALQQITQDKMVYIGDVAQSIYGKRFTWVGVVGSTFRPLELQRNFRNTRQIFEAADSILKFEYVVNEASRQEYSQDITETQDEGNRPQLFLLRNEQSQLEHIILKIKEILSDYPNERICIGFRKTTAFKFRVLKALSKAGIEYQTKLSQDTGKTPVVVSSFHSMKGLSFDHVILAEMDDAIFEDAIEETDADVERRLVFVAMTRARKTLSLFVGSDQPVRYLTEISPTKILPIVWNPTAFDTLFKEQIQRLNVRRAILREEFERYTHRIAELESELEQAQSELAKTLEQPISQVGFGNEKISKLTVDIENEKQHQLEVEAKLMETKVQDQLAHNQLDLEPATYYFSENAKLLILGGDGGFREKHLPGLLKEYGLAKDAYEWIPYDEMKHFDISTCYYSTKYSDIIVGATPHSTKGIGNSSSLIQFIREHQIELPKVHILEQNGVPVKLSKEDFRKVLPNTALYGAVKGI